MAGATCLTPALTLTNEVVELILVLSLRRVQHVTGTFAEPDPQVTAPLNVLSRLTVPTPTKIALLLMPFVPLEAAAASGGADLLDAMASLARKPKLHRPLTYSSMSPNFVTIAAGLGHVSVLEWWLNNKAKLHLFVDTSQVLVEASRAGNVSVLTWWYGNDLPMHVPADVWALASEAGHANVLDFWLKVGVLDQKHSHEAMDRASAAGHAHVLDWWRNSGLGVDYSHVALAGAIANKRYLVLDWWAGSGLRLLADEEEVTLAAIDNADLRALEWLDAHGLLAVRGSMLASLFCSGNERCVAYCMDRFRKLPMHLDPPPRDLFVRATATGRFDVINDLLCYGFVVPRAYLESVEPCLAAAARSGSIALLDWWLDDEAVTQLKLAAFSGIVVAAAECGHVHVLEWVDSNRPRPVDDAVALDAMRAAAGMGHVNVLEWFEESHRGLDLSHDIFFAAVDSARLNVLKWWSASERAVPSLLDESNQALLVQAASRGDMNIVKLWYLATPFHVRTKLLSHVSFAKDVLLAACKAGHLLLVQWWVCLTGARDPQWIAEASEQASEANSVQILDWFLEMDLFDTTQCYHAGINAAGRAGNVRVIHWWWYRARARGFKPLLVGSPQMGENRFIDPTNKRAAVRTCLWFMDQGISLVFELPKELVAVGEPALLDRLLASRTFQLPSSYSVWDEASQHGNVALLDWWMEHDTRIVFGTEFPHPKQYSRAALVRATQGGFLHVLDWWKASGLWVDMPCLCIEKVSMILVQSVLSLSRRKEVFEWWRNSGLLHLHEAGSNGVMSDTGEDDDDHGAEEGDEDGDSANTFDTQTLLQVLASNGDY